MERTIQVVQPMKLAERKLLRVAAYARVSCDKDAMRHSLQAQVDYYKKMITDNPDWSFAGVYPDAYYTGTRDDRPQFVQLIKDCKDGKIDRVITKTISRFARNTLTLLTVARDLRRMGIGIYFEEQNIDTLTEAGELMITLLASQAQEESRATSENCKWRIKKKFEEGYTTHFNMVGYRAVDGLVEVVPEEVGTVRRIFQLYLEGYGKQAIANILFKEGVPSCLGGEWVATTIQSMLHNEKYVGDLLLQKQFRVDHLEKKDKKNEGELPQYFIQDNHEAIIPRAEFDTVQADIKHRAAALPAGHGRHIAYPFSKKLLCAHCGKNYRRRCNSGIIAWSCATFMTYGRDKCSARQVRESILEECAARALGIPAFDPAAF